MEGINISEVIRYSNDAFENKHFKAYYQPKYNIPSNLMNLDVLLRHMVLLHLLQKKKRNKGFERSPFILSLLSTTRHRAC